jgi:hypothetical protein
MVIGPTGVRISRTVTGVAASGWQRRQARYPAARAAAASGMYSTFFGSGFRLRHDGRQ